MLRIADVIEANFDELGLLETLDMGAPVARTSLFKRWLLQAFRFYAAQAVNIRGETLENSFPGSFMSYTVKDPIGVVGGIIPWNGRSEEHTSELQSLMRTSYSVLCLTKYTSSQHAN